METPSHDAVSPERLKDPREREKAKRTFQAARRSIRAAIDEAVGTDERYEESNIHELSEILPDEFDPDLPGNTALVSKEGNPPSLNTMVEVDSSAGEDDDEDVVKIDEDGFIIENGGGESGGESGEGNGGDGENKERRGRVSGRGGDSRSRSILGKPLYIANGLEDAYSCTVVFELSEKVERITLTLRPAGAERGEKMRPIEIASASLLGQDLDCGEGDAIQIPNPPTGQRLTVKIKTVESIANRAISAAGDLKA